MRTLLCDRLGIEIPIVQAPMAGSVGPAIAAAVSNAGGLGTLAPWRFELAGAASVWIGTRFLAAEEAAIHPEYRRRLFAASESDTIYLSDLFNVGWPNAPHRVLRNSTVKNWEAAGRIAPGQGPGEGEIIATSRSRGNVMRYQSFSAGPNTEGDIDLPLWSGQGAALVRKVQPAAEILHEISREASQVIASAAARL